MDLLVFVARAMSIGGRNDSQSSTCFFSSEVASTKLLLEDGASFLDIVIAERPLASGCVSER